MSTHSTDGELDASIAPDEASRAVEVVCQSATFSRTERLQRFLRYVSDLTLRGEAGKINEYLIGSEVFDRGENYSPQEDAVVRRQAHALRRKLQEYYWNEGQNDAIQIDLPVGHYVPVFRRRESQPAAATSEVAPKPVPDARPDRRTLVVGALTLVGVAFSAGWGVANWRREPLRDRREALPAVVREIWGPWLDDPAGAVICFSNSLTTIVSRSETPLPPGSHPTRIPFTAQEQEILRRAFDLPAATPLYWTPALSHAKMGEALGAVQLATLFARAGTPLSTTQSRFLSWEDLRKDNLILLGHNEANPLQDPLLERYPLQLAAKRKDRPRCIVNREPKASEAAEYCLEYPGDSDQARNEYALVSMIPGVERGRKLLLIGGLNTQATQAAVEFLTDPGSLEELLSSLHQSAPGRQGPWHMQVILRAEVRNKVPTRTSVVAFRALP